MMIRDFKGHLSKIRTGMGVLIQKSKAEPEYRRIAIYTLILLAITVFLSPWLGVLLVIAGAWYLTY
ncbi:hypothetical protein P4B35_02200 [Pontiellaceae bacterium B12227]|nr:hypothetical protein [Pontiellaceae bacterium B12227]